MTSITVQVKLDTKELDRIAVGLGKNTHYVLGLLANDLAEGAASRAPIDTGALKSSINAYDRGEYLFHVEDKVDYGIYQEFGTWKMAAHPFMVPAAESTGKLLNSGALWRRLFA